ncbi:UNVERIFIED_CONTAM: hypothetical protein Slati_1789900 [Sesamum latifolium]|uniref:PUM-HD domain-containing protein n=1 Tax=Sesamum latifolium TaxID=2727402 RepID=A0AAW2WY63_9LAMI
MGKDGTFGLLALSANSQSNDSDASQLDDDSKTFSVFSFKSEEEGVPVTTTGSKKIKIVSCVLGQDNSSTKDNIWGCPRFFTTTSAGEKDVSNQNLMDHQHRSNHLVHHFRSRSLPVPYADPRGDDRELKKSLVSELLPSIFMLILNRRLHCIYCMLVDACEGQQLDSLVVRVLSQGEYFLRAAFDQQGASSIVKLIIKVKKSLPHAMVVTRVLSTGFMDIMTHPTARDVILQCLLLFPTQPNEVLYEKTILYFQNLVIHEVGYRSLNDCIAFIGGDQRVQLLNQIADVSDFLSYDPYGLPAKSVRTIGGEKRRKPCGREMHGSFEQWGVNCRGAGNLQALARNQFGNYVIQAALKKTKERGFSSFYDAIVRCLEPHRRALRQTAGGKNVLSIVEADDE